MTEIRHQRTRGECFRRDMVDLTMGGISAMFATFFTNPIEVVKTRLQLQGELKARGKHAVFYKSVPHGLYVIGTTEGLRALQNGLPAMMGFQFCLNVFRLGSYRIADRRGFLIGSDGRRSVIKGAAVAGVGGGIGSIAGTPFFLVKTRLQSQAKQAIAVGHQHKHTGTFSALIDIYSKEGVKGLFRGVGPQIPRGMTGSASQILSFTYAKDWLLEHNWFVNNPLLLSFFGANLGGLVMTLCLNPFDVAATRLCNQPVDAQNKGKLYNGMLDCFYKIIRHEGAFALYKAVNEHNRGKLYNGMIDCFIKMVRQEGAMSLYKGVWANYIRLGPHTVMLLVCWDQLKILETYLSNSL